MIMINETTAVAVTPSELAEAISQDNGVNRVFLGGSISMTSGIRVHPNKTSLTIDGRYPPESEEKFTLTDTGSDTGQIYVDASQSLDLTFQNLTINGRNYFGMPRVYDYSGAENVAVNYRNVTYAGPQITWHVRGLARYIDCDITIMYAGHSPMQEVAEINRVEIGGKTTIRHNNGNSFAVFFFYKANPYFTVLEDAEVEISTLRDFLYNEINYVDFTVKPRARLTLTTQRGISRDSLHRAANFLVDEGAVFKYIRNGGGGNAHALYVNGAFTVKKGASVYMQADAKDGVGSILRFTSVSSGFYINDPRSVAFYNGGTASTAAALSFASSVQVSINAGQLNYWQAATPFPTAGTFIDIPKYKWIRDDLSGFTIRGTAASGATSISFNDFTDDELKKLPDLSLLQLQSAKTLSMGNLRFAPDAVIHGSPITGSTEPYANVRVEYTSGSSVYTQIDAADERGDFSIDVVAPMPAAGEIALSANTPFLIVTTAGASEGGLYISEAPQSIGFIVRPMAEFTETVILPRLFPDAPVIVTDEREEKTEWRLWASITDPLATEDNDVLTDGVVFVDETGEIVTMGSTPIPVYVGVHATEPDYYAVWAHSKGVLARVTVPMRSGKEYTTRLLWEVYPSDAVPPK